MQNRVATNHASDAAMLAAMRVFTILTNMISGAILSRALSLASYGTYSAGNLLITTAALATQLGLMDAANYYYHWDAARREAYLHTIFFLQTGIGIACGVIILLAQKAITAFFQNPMLGGMYLYLAFRPMLTNYYCSLLPLQAAVGKARAVAYRNAALAVAKLLVVLAVAATSGRVDRIFAAHLALDAFSVFYFYRNFRNAAFSIQIHKASKKLIAPILRFSIPMGVYVMVHTLTKDLDKLLIGRLESPEQLAIYANCSAQLPLNIISAAVLTVLLPDITRLVQDREDPRAARLYHAYLRIGMISAWILAAGCIFLSEEMVLLLYGQKYLPGTKIFSLYVIVDAVQFSGATMVLTARQKTKTLMKYAFWALACNGVLNYVLYLWLGAIGPAAATVVVSAGFGWKIVKESADELKVGVGKLLDWKYLGRFTVQICLALLLLLPLRQYLRAVQRNCVVILAVVLGILYGSLLFLNRREIRSAVSELNSEHAEP